MEGDEGDLSPELTQGSQLQKVWTQLRGYVLSDHGQDSASSLAAGDTPPSPYSLFIGMQEHLYPFLQCLSLFYHSLSGIKFVHSSGMNKVKYTNTLYSLSHDFQHLRLRISVTFVLSLACHSLSRLSLTSLTYKKLLESKKNAIVLR